ncbi:MAG: thioredoxin family protein [Holosporaceae bacterium]|nr:thioredoxin family protein [Holosporaceae bacterium]
MCVFFAMLLCFRAAAFVSPDVDLSVEKEQIHAGTFRCSVILSLPRGWKLAQMPNISPLKLKNLKNFLCSEKYEKISDTVYKIYFFISVADRKNPDNLLELTMDCSLCKDLCAIVSKNISLSFEYDTADQSEETFFSRSLCLFLLLGFVGGFLLNLTPCVLPVVLMKFRSLGRGSAVWGSIAGNYLTFAAFAAFLAFLKAGGGILGWGLHFQNAIVLEIMAVYLFLLSLYSFGIITTAFPSFQIENVKRNAFWSNFFSSIIASAVAIPCTAPVLGTAAAFAIQGSIAEMCLVFFAIGTGFSVPYLLAFSLPFSIPSKISQFSGFFKKIIDCGVLITFLWVLYLLSYSLDQKAFLAHAITFALLAFLLARRCAKTAALLGIIFLCWSVDYLRSKEISKDKVDVLSKVSSRLAEKRVVLFNITAVWCPTCHYNKYQILNDERVIRAMRDYDVEYLEGDMTHKNDELMQLIRNNHRVGIPFTIVYGPGAPKGILLGEMPSVPEVIEAIKKARATTHPPQ